MRLTEIMSSSSASVALSREPVQSTHEHHHETNDRRHRGRADAPRHLDPGHGGRDRPGDGRDADGAGGGEQTCAGMEAMQGLTGAPDPDPAAVIQATPAAPDIIASM
jgi:hypothetical protein